ncbi:MAG: hypothetical protein PWP51_1570 [Clostridiales bacterium]|jgi:hypothetical protein|nr:hypothetical protein [Clostridiales bacterium]MDN5299017.1 hypothetical protein [Clostridiales bacterium]
MSQWWHDFQKVGKDTLMGQNFLKAEADALNGNEFGIAL